MDRVAKGIFKELFLLKRKEIATPDKMERCDYLKPISKVITQMDCIEVGMLIGPNCIKAFHQMEIMSSRNWRPYAYKTKLRWCIAGPITTSRNDGSVKCHRITVKNIVSG